MRDSAIVVSDGHNHSDSGRQTKMAPQAAIAPASGEIATSRHDPAARRRASRAVTAKVATVPTSTAASATALPSAIVPPATRRSTIATTATIASARRAGAVSGEEGGGARGTTAAGGGRHGRAGGEQVAVDHEQAKSVETGNAASVEHATVGGLPCAA